MVSPIISYLISIDLATLKLHQHNLYTPSLHSFLQGTLLSPKQQRHALKNHQCDKAIKQLKHDAWLIQLNCRKYDLEIDKSEVDSWWTRLWLLIIMGRILLLVNMETVHRGRRRGIQTLCKGRHIDKETQWVPYGWSISKMSFLDMENRYCWVRCTALITKDP